MVEPVQILIWKDVLHTIISSHICFIFILSNIFSSKFFEHALKRPCQIWWALLKRKSNSVPLPSSRVKSQMRGSTACVRRPITRLKEDIGMKVPCRDICPMHWHPSHATKSAASPSRCLWSINNKLLTSFTANASNNTPVRLREGGWQIHNSPVNRFSHTSQ